MKKTLLIGEPIGLFIARETGPLDKVKTWETSTAGAELNVAVGLRRLEQGVGYYTKLGKDPLAKVLVSRMEEDGIDTSLITYHDTEFTAFQLKQKVEEGDPECFNFRNHSAARTLSKDDLKDADWNDYDWLHCTGIFSGLTETTREAMVYAVSKAREFGMTVSFDPNLRPYLWPSTEAMADYMNKMASKADIFLPGIKECRICIGEDDPEKAAQKYLDMGCKCVIIKLGAEGAYYATKEESGYVEGFKVEKIIDTVGAGDGFAAGVISALKEGLSLREAVRRGNAIGAIQLTSKGDNDGLPTREELTAFMEGRKDWRK